jgi:3-deoxy-D-manno-octulosonate 8-phosphate phosphatase (KDO 8-P phosphatase)
MKLDEHMASIRAIVTDVDGCFTDGGIFYGSQSIEAKVFDVKDGMGVTIANQAGFVTAIITGRSSEAVERRAQELGFAECFQGYGDKRPAWKLLKERHGLADEEIAYLGDDIQDLPLLTRAGCSFAPADAVTDVRERVDITLERPGGRGAFREMVVTILKAQDRWESVLSTYLNQ